MRHICAILCAVEDIPNKNRKLTQTVKLISIFLKALNVIQTLLATFCKHFIEFFILEFFFSRKINIVLKKSVFKPDGGQFAKLQKVSVILLSFSIK